MVTDPPAEDEDPETGPGDGSVDDEDPIEEVDFWEEVGQTRPAREEDLSGTDIETDDGAAEPASGPGDDEPLPDREAERWPGIDEAETERADGEPEEPADGEPEEPADGEPDDETSPGLDLGAEGGDRDLPDRPSSEIDAEERLSRGSGPDGVDLGIGPDEEADGEPDPEAGAPGPEETGTPEDREPEPWPDAPDRDLPDEDEAEPVPDEAEVETTPPDAASAPEPESSSERIPEVEDLVGDGAEADGPSPAAEDEEPPTEIVTDLDLGTDVERTIPRLRERGPVEAGDAPLEGVEEADGPCHVCTPDEDEEPTPGRHTCVSCEEPACSSHFWVMFGLCEGCATEEQIRKLRGERTYADWAAFLGIKWVD